MKNCHIMFNGIGIEAGNLPRLSRAVSRSVSAENKTGAPGRGAMADPSDSNFTGSGPARELGVGWKVSPSIDIAEASGETVLADIEGPGAIESMWFGGYVQYDLILRIYWEDQKIPSVEAPLSAFFGQLYCGRTDASTGDYPKFCSALLMAAPRSGLSCYFEMPFRKRCRITVENISPGKKTLYYQINYTLTEIDDDCAYFHAQYRQSRTVGNDGEHIVLDGIKGKGQYIGMSLAVGINGPGGWWGGGSVEFYENGENRMSSCGIDGYFLGSGGWESGGKYTTYSCRYAGMYQFIKEADPFNAQERFLMYRFHLPDPVRFNGSFRAVISDIGSTKDGKAFQRYDEFMSVGYWYQLLPTQAFPELPEINDLEVQ